MTLPNDLIVSVAHAARERPAPTPRTDEQLRVMQTEGWSAGAQLMQLTHNSRKYEREAADLRHDIERAVATNAELATENSKLRGIMNATFGSEKGAKR